MKRDFQDKTFQLCCEYSDFSQYLTNINDLEKCPSKEIILDGYERMMMDSMFKSQSQNILTGIEHQSTITKKIMFRNLRYNVNAEYKYEKPVRPYIFHTGKRIAPACYIFNDYIQYKPNLIQTYEKDGMKIFNTIKDKLKNNNTSSLDIYDLIWLPQFGNIEINEDFFKEYIDVASQFKDDEKYPLLKRVVTGWINRFEENEEVLKYLKEKLDMMALDSPEFMDYIATAIYEREMEKRDKIIEEVKNKNKELANEIAYLKELLAKKEE